MYCEKCENQIKNEFFSLKAAQLKKFLHDKYRKMAEEEKRKGDLLHERFKKSMEQRKAS